MAARRKPIPVYEGDLPYIYFAFSSVNLPRVRPILKLLLARGFRIWYCLGAAGSADELLRRQKRAKGAALTLLYLSSAEENDRDLKNYILDNQKAGLPILALDSDGKDRYLSMNLREETPMLHLPSLTGESTLETALLQSGRLTQEMIGERIDMDDRPRRLPLLLCVAAALVFLGLAVFRFVFFPASAEPQLILNDNVLQAAALEATGGSLTEESITSITELQLEELPENWEELALMPALRRLVIDQFCITDATALPEGVSIVLSGGAAG